MPKISVIVPIYKVEAYLEKCINSLINQTAHDHEIILVDDGSPDGCPDICDKYAKLYDYIYVIHKPNGGVSSARNVGIEKAKGEFIWFVDADDYVETKSIEFLLAKIKQNYDLVVFNGKCSCVEQIVDYNIFFREQYLNYSLSFAPWNKLYKKEIIIKNNIRFDLEEKIGEDLLFNAQYYRYMHNYVIDKMNLYHYEQREDSAMHIGKPERLIQQMRVYDKLMGVWRAILEDDICCCLFIMHLIAGINQSKNSGITKREYREYLRKHFGQVCFSGKAWKEGTKMFFTAEGATMLGKIRTKLFLRLNRWGVNKLI